MDLEREAAAQVQQLQKKKWVMGDSYGLLSKEVAVDFDKDEMRIRLPDIGAALRRVMAGRREVAELVSGALAGAMAKAVLAPLETVRTRMVVGVGSRQIPGAFAEIVQESGWRGLWAGNGINMLRIAPTQAIEVATFEAVRRALLLKKRALLLKKESLEKEKLLLHDHHQKKEKEKKEKSLLCLVDQALLRLSPVAAGGAAAGMVSTLLCHPLEVLKDRLTVSPAAYPSLGVALAKIHAEAGLGGFYAGLLPTLAGMLPYSTCYYFMYHTIKRSYCRSKNRKNDSLARPELLLIGALSGLTASTISFPLEVARKRLMVGAIEGKCPAHMFGALSEVVREEGLAGLYRGWGASCLKVMPNSGITWMFYEAWKDILLVGGSA